MNFREKEKTNANDLLSLSKNLTVPSKELQTSTQKPNKLQSGLVQKQVLLVYVDNDKMYINRSAAYALGLTDVRAIMVNSAEDLVAISKMQLATVLSRDNVEIKFEKIALDQKSPERQQIKVYRNNLNYYIDMSAAYALGLISIETFNAMSNELYPVSDNLLVFLQNKYDVEFQELGENFGSR